MHTEKRNVVLDTNVIISAFISPFGAPAKVFELFLEKNIINYTSKEIIEELTEVIYRQKIVGHIAGRDKQFMLNNFEELSVIITPGLKEKAIKDDPEGNKFINCALTVKANIVSGDSHLLKLREYKGINILSPKEFLKKC